MKMKATPVFRDVYNAYNSKTTINHVLEGGSRSSKTYSIIQFIIVYCQQNEGKKITIARAKMTWLRASVLQDFMTILREYGIYEKRNDKTSSQVYAKYNLMGNEIYFLGLDDPQKIHGSKQDIFWINEAIEARYNDFKQLNQRTSEFFILDYNPSTTIHWIFDKVLNRDDVHYNHSTQLDNPFLPKRIRNEILAYEPTEENRRRGTADELAWKIYGLGIRGISKGTVYTDWERGSEIPETATYIADWLDWGFANDPTAAGHLWKDHNTLYLQEYCYETGLVNIDIEGRASIENVIRNNNINNQLIIADSAEMKSIFELQSKQYNILPATKYNGSVVDGIKLLQKYKLVIINSPNIEHELINYKWKEATRNDNREYKPEPIDAFNHHLDGIRYVMLYAEMQKQT